ncbi:MAG TPA: Hsp20/alpha crystallin family protein [Planctomycetota bacterium]|nr:Hsp20/alpha crystallin family protein [Planctomycetota bacterium]
MRNLPLHLPRFGNFHRLFDDLMMQALPTVEPTVTPRLDIWEEEGAYGLAIELPGFRLEDIELSVDDHELCVVARHAAATANETASSTPTENASAVSDAEVSPPAEAAASQRTWHRRERVYRPFARKIQLPHDIDAQAAEAKLEHGVLEIRLPKQAGKRKVQIQVRA